MLVTIFALEAGWPQLNMTIKPNYFHAEVEENCGICLSLNTDLGCQKSEQCYFL